MRPIVFLFSIVCLVFVEASFVGWHENIGIKEAEKIRATERGHIIANTPIVGGVIAPLNAHPHLAGILIDVVGASGPSACGGSLVTSTRVLTAAHCWFDGRSQAWRFTVVLGSTYLFHGGLRIPTSMIAIHPQYNPQRLSNDIAMIYLPIHVPFSNIIRPVTLPSGLLLQTDFTGVWTVASGYGKYSDKTNPTMNTLVRHVPLQLIPLAQCRQSYGNLVEDSNICTSGNGGVGICRGDSGGPLTLTVNGQSLLLGISSFVAADGCELGHPSVYVSVAKYMPWISMHV